MIEGVIGRAVDVPVKVNLSIVPIALQRTPWEVVKVDVLCHAIPTLVTAAQFSVPLESMGVDDESTKIGTAENAAGIDVFGTRNADQLLEPSKRMINAPNEPV